MIAATHTAEMQHPHHWESINLMTPAE